MALVAIQCKNCGGALQVDSSAASYYCPHCHTKWNNGKSEIENEAFVGVGNVKVERGYLKDITTGQTSYNSDVSVSVAKAEDVFSVENNGRKTEVVKVGAEFHQLGAGVKIDERGIKASIPEYKPADGSVSFGGVSKDAIKNAFGAEQKDLANQDYDRKELMSTLEGAVNGKPGNTMDRVSMTMSNGASDESNMWETQSGSKFENGIESKCVSQLEEELRQEKQEHGEIFRRWRANTQADPVKRAYAEREYQESLDRIRSLEDAIKSRK